MDDDKISTYSSSPGRIRDWLSSYVKTKTMCGNKQSLSSRRKTLTREEEYLITHVRGLYTKCDVNEGDLLTCENYYAAVPYNENQISTRDVDLERHQYRFTTPRSKDQPILKKWLKVVNIDS